MATVREQETLRRAQEIASKVLAEMGYTWPVGPRWRYWSSHRYTWHFQKRGRRMFCYRTDRDSNGRFASWDYVCRKAGGPLQPRNKVYHSIRRAARERARKRWEKYQVQEAKGK